MTKILITGGTGFLGSNIVNRLSSQGFSVTVLIRKESCLKRLESNKSNINFIFFSDLNSFFKNNKISGIIHLATNYGRKNESLNDIIDSNVIFPVNLFKMAIDNDVDFFINTDTSLPRDLNYYSLSKAQFKDWLKNIPSSIKIINVIPEYFYGPNDDMTKFVTSMLDKLQNNIDFIDLSEGTQLRDFIYIDDIVNAYQCIVENVNNFKNYTDVPIGSATTISLKNLVLLIKKLSNNKKTVLNFGKIPIRKGEIMESKANISFMNKLGWNPVVSIEEGISIIIKQDYNNN